MIAFRTTLNVGFFGDMRTARKKVKPEMAEIAQKRYGEKEAQKEETTKEEAAVVGGAARRGDARGATQLRRDTLFDPRNDTGLVDGGLRVQSLTGSELQVLYTSNGSPLLHEVFKRSVN